MATFFAYINNPFVASAVALVLGVVFSQKIKDWLAGVTPEVRNALRGVETKAKQDIAHAVSAVLHDLPAPAPLKPVAPPPAPVQAPLAPVLVPVDPPAPAVLEPDKAPLPPA